MLKSGTEGLAPPLRCLSQELRNRHKGLLSQDGVTTLACSEVISGSCVEVNWSRSRGRGKVMSNVGYKSVNKIDVGVFSVGCEYHWLMKKLLWAYCSAE